MAKPLKSLKEELKQNKPWPSLEEEAALNVARTSAVLEHALAQALKPFDITPTQYNVLRILRGAGDAGLCRSEVGERMVRRVPDVTRLLDRLEDTGYIARARGGEDRRYVTTRITPEGLEALSSLDAVVAGFLEDHLGHLGEEQRRALVDLLSVLRHKR